MPTKRTTSTSDHPTRIAEAALRLLETQEWRTMTLASVARSARLPLSDVLSVVPSKSAVPGVVLRTLAKETARRHKVDARSADPRERLFDVTMAFFDVQERRATALRKLYNALQHDPPTLLAARDDILRVAGELLALAEADVASSPQVQSALFAGVLIRAVAVWRDDDAEMGKTMARLDGDLRRAARFLWPKSWNVSRSAKAKSERRRRHSNKTNLS